VKNHDFKGGLLYYAAFYMYCTVFHYKSLVGDCKVYFYIGQKKIKDAYLQGKIMNRMKEYEIPK
jgi:hypothetical protein